MAIKFTELKETYHRLPPARKTPEVKQFMCDLIQVEIDKAPKRELESLSKLLRYLQRELESQEPIVVLLRPTDDTGETGDDSEEPAWRRVVCNNPTEAERIMRDNEQSDYEFERFGRAAVNETGDDPDVNLESCGDDTGEDDDRKTVEELVEATKSQVQFAAGMASMMKTKAEFIARIAAEMYAAAEASLDCDDDKSMHKWRDNAMVLEREVGEMGRMAEKQVEFHSTPIIHHVEVD